MKLFQFSKPKNPGFGISSDFYLTVLSSKAVLPTILEVINPAGANDAVEGFGAPLSPSADKAALSRPIERGVWVLASKDRKTVLRLRVLSKEEAGFDPGAFVRSKHADEVSPEVVDRLKATWSLLQLTLESHDAMVYPALDFLADLCDRIGKLTDGVIADPICARYLLPGELRHMPRVDARIDARDHVVVRSRPSTPSSLAVFTAGLRKFSLPELTIDDLEASDLGKATSFLLATSQAVLLGKKIGPTDRLGDFRVSPVDPADRAWDGIPALELRSDSGNRQALARILN